MDKSNLKNLETAVTRGVESTKNNVHKAISSASAATHEATDKVLSGANQAAHVLSEQGAHLKESQKRLTQNTMIQIRERPLEAVGVALAVGFLLSWCFKKR